MMKLAARDMRISRVFLSGATICGIVREKPIPSILVITKTSTPRVPIPIRKGSN
jgi:hypothetical protein